MYTFRVTLPAPLNPDESISLSVLDEVTGLALNTRNYFMNADDELHYSVILPFAVGSVVKYRYLRSSNFSVQEHFTDGRPVRYRMLHIPGPGIVDDVISRWTDTLFSGPTGRLIGEVLNQDTGYPLPGILICVGGIQTLTAADGTFFVEGLPIGKHNLVAYAMDGAYYIFQQEAVVAPDSATPAPIKLLPAPFVTLSFNVKLPNDTHPEAVVRLAGNLSQTGNTFADLMGGVSTVAVRMPTLTRLPDGRYNLTLDLPAGVDLRYRYTLGDGLWSAEMGDGGSAVLRQVIVPDRDITINDVVGTWGSIGQGSITFHVSAPTIPENQGVSIQFNPGFSWMEPVPMWPLGDRQWTFVLTSPLKQFGEIGYRYCRDDQCGKADDIRTPGSDSPPLGLLAITAQSVVQTDIVEDWTWNVPFAPAIVPGVTVTPRGEDFLTGIEFLAAYDPTWQSRWVWAVRSALGLEANELFLSSTWTFTRPNPPLLEPLSGQDIPWTEIMNLVTQTRASGLRAAIVAVPHFPIEPAIWWQNATRDFPWWVTWFDQYRTFALHHADLATQSGAEILVLGGEAIEPALPTGRVSGSPSGVPGDAEERWRTLLGEVRSHYDGQLVWALPYPQGVQSPPAFLDMVDAVQVLWLAPLATSETTDELQMEIEAARLLDSELAPFQRKINRPLWLGISYPSADGGATGCVAASTGGCLSMNVLARLQEDVPDVRVNLQEQTSAYLAMLSAVDSRSWINGIVSRGFYPPLPLQDKSASIYGKPAAGVLWFWYAGWR